MKGERTDQAIAIAILGSLAYLGWRFKDTLFPKTKPDDKTIGSFNSNPLDNPQTYASSITGSGYIRTPGGVDIQRVEPSIAGDSILNLRKQNPDGSITTYHADLNDLSDPQKRALQMGNWDISNGVLQFLFSKPTENQIRNTSTTFDASSVSTPLIQVSGSGITTSFVNSPDLGQIKVTDLGSGVLRITSTGGNLAPVGNYAGSSGAVISSNSNSSAGTYVSGKGYATSSGGYSSAPTQKLRR